MNLILLKEISAEYEKHDWKLQRILIECDADDLKDNEIKKAVGNVEIRPSAVDAAWFSRPSKGTREAWELRIIAEQPFALFESFSSDVNEEKREQVRNEMETRLANISSQKKAVLTED